MACHLALFGQVYTRLSERLGVADHVAVLNIMLQKIAVNLKAFASCEDVISHTLNLFQVCARFSCAAFVRSACSSLRIILT